MNDALDHLPILIVGVFMLAAATGRLPKTRRGDYLLKAFGAIVLVAYVARRTGLIEAHLPIGRDFGLLLDLVAAVALIAAFVVVGRSRLRAA